MKLHRIGALCLAALLAITPLTQAKASWSAEPEEVVQPPALPEGEMEQKLAQMLYELGLFMGTDQGFELGRTMTRAEAAVMITRLLGGEQEALEKNYKTSFNDVPDWAAPYVGWLYKQGLTKGISTKQYGSQSAITFAQYCVMLARQFVDQNWSFEEVAQSGYVASTEEYAKDGDKPIWRGEAVKRGAGTLFIPGGNQPPMAEEMMRKGMFTPEEFEKAARPIYGCTYASDYERIDKAAQDAGKGRVYRLVNGVKVAQSELIRTPLQTYPFSGNDDFLLGVEEHTEAGQGYGHQDIYLYRVDLKSLSVIPIPGKVSATIYPQPWGQQGDRWYFLMEHFDQTVEIISSNGYDLVTVQKPGLISSKENRSYGMKQFPEGLYVWCSAGAYKLNQGGTALEACVVGDQVGSMLPVGNELYFTTYAPGEFDGANYHYEPNHQIYKMDTQGQKQLVLDAQNLGLSPRNVTKYKNGKLYFEAKGTEHFSPKGFITYEYCYDGARVNVTGAQGDGIDLSMYTVEELAQIEQKRLDACYETPGKA